MSSAPGGILESMARRARVDAVRLHLLVADRCNHACGHCYQVQGLKGEMPLADVLAAIDEFRSCGGMVLSISGGEPTLRDDLMEILAHAQAIGLATILYTNGFLIDERQADGIAASDVWRVDISVYSDLPEEHDNLTRVPGSWRRAVRAIQLLVRRGVRVLMKTTLTTAASSTSFERMAALASSLGCEWQVADLVSSGEGGSLRPLDARLLPDAAAEFLGPAHGDFGCVAEHKPELSKLDSPPCGIASSALTVRSDGALTPCTHVPVVLARSLVGVSLARALQESDVVAVLRSLTWRDVHGCRDCDLLPLCGRCHATALGETGDMLGPYPGGCGLARSRHAQISGNGQVHRPASDCGPERDAQVGPYRAEPGGALRPIRDLVSPADLELVSRFPWIRATKAELEALSARPAPQLVRLRRKGEDIDLDTSDAPV